MDTSSTAMPSIGKLEIKSPSNGIDPSLMALLGNRTGGGMLGGSEGGGGILLLLLLAMFQRNGGGGLFGGNGADGGSAAAAQAISTSKDVMAQINTFQSWASNNASQLATQICGIDKSICASSANVINAVKELTPQMFTAFTAQTAAINDGFGIVRDSQTATLAALNANDARTQLNLSDGFSATQLQFQVTSAAAAIDNCKISAAAQLEAAKNFAATSLQITNGDYALAQQLAACCCENRLAIANQNTLIERSTCAIETQAAANYAALANQMNVQTCELKQAVHFDGQATRDLINANRTNDLLAQLNDAKAQISNNAQTAAILAAMKPCHGA